MKVFKRKWNEAARTVTETTIKALMAGVPEKFRNSVNKHNIKILFLCFNMNIPKNTR